MLAIKKPSHIYYLLLLAFALWSLMILGTSYLDIRGAKQNTLDMAEKEIMMLFDKDLALRQWVSRHNGVYVPVSEHSQPSPYLKHISERDITTPSGKKLTLMDPACILRQSMASYADKHNISVRIISLAPLNPINAPDNWERQSLIKIAAGATEILSVDESTGEPYFRLIKPVTTSQDCLRCHGHQGYKIGEIRGGVSISIPLGGYLLHEKQSIRRIILYHFSFWLIGSIVLSLMALWSRNRLIDQRKILHSLQKSEDDYKEVQQIAHIGHWELDIVNDTLFWSEEIYKIFDIDPKKFTPNYKLFLDHVHPNDRDKVNEAYTTSLINRSQYSFTHRIITEKGQIKYVQGNCRTEYNAAGSPTSSIGTIQDITGYKRAEKARVRLETAINQTADSILITDSLGYIQYVNPSFEKITGYCSDEVIGKKTSILKSSEQDSHFYRKMWETLSSGEVWKGQLTNRKKDGSLFIEEATISPVFDSDDEIINYVAVKRDITEITQIEKKLIQSQKMEAIGTLAGGIAHDFNNILGAILGYADLALEDSPKGSSVAKDLEKVLSAGYRAQDLVKQILAFSHQGNAECHCFKPTSIIKEAIKLLRPSLPATIVIVHDIDPETGPIFADPTQIHQVLMNLCTNAFHAMEEKGGKLGILLKETYLTNGDLAHEPNLESGHFVQLSISDTGPGIAPEIKDKIFEPFFTTKKVGKGTGMGLSIIHGIVKSSGGFIALTSELGQGTTFDVFFPVAKDEVLTVKKDNDRDLTGRESILFIDDETILTEIGKDILERLGYHVTISNNCFEALEIFQDQPHQFDLVITDQTMPGMTGDDLSRKMLLIRPDIPIILCTGYSSTITEKSVQALGIRKLALKPLVKKDIARLARKVLDGS